MILTGADLVIVMAHSGLGQPDAPQTAAVHERALAASRLLAALFESFAQPFTIMFSVPFALLGVGLVMKLADQPWDSMTILGMVVLLGVVVNNAIVLIDHINYLRQQGLSRTEAIIRGGQNRMRPILITAVTTIVADMTGYPVDLLDPDGTVLDTVELAEHDQMGYLGNCPGSDHPNPNRITH